MNHRLSPTLSTPSRSGRSGYFLAAGFFGLAFVLLSVVVALRWLGGLDLDAGLVGHFQAPCWALNASEAVSPLASGEFCLLYAGGLVVWCLAHRRPRLAIWLVGLLLALVVVEFAFKFA